ncbi:hypothetical protein DDE83_002257 [Stemphylium lycopersici]|uniref:Uncharacterized protein n=1 Tax=Stemphylium lycopersici TaxID=183478 RepID=A0A364NAT6_STELY|nr:hypothetical protein DDE83_002257 [Stemphylium lycopersici]
MQFTIPLLALVASASASMGSWNVTIEKYAYANGYSMQTVNAQFVSDSYLDGLFSNCTTISNPVDPSTNIDACIPLDFSYNYDGTTLKVQQNIQKPDPGVTVFGEAPLELKGADAVGRHFKGNAIFDVTRAIA